MKTDKMRRKCRMKTEENPSAVSVEKKHNPFLKFRHAIQSLIKVLILLGATAAFIWCVVRWYPESDFHFWGYVMFAVLYLIVLVSFVNMYRCFNIGTLRKRELTIGFFIAMFLTNFVMYFVLCLLCKFIVNGFPLGLVTLIQIVYGVLLLLLANTIFFKLRPSRDAIMILSASHKEQDTLAKFGSLRDRYRICAVVSETDGYESVIKKIEGFNTVICGVVDAAFREKLVNYCFEKGKRLFVLPSVQDIILHNAHETFVGDSLTYLCRNRAFLFEQLFIKRVIDVVVSLIGIVITSPIMLVTALLIKLQDGGPVFFKQLRYTRNFETFTMIKFRSMIVDAEKDGARFTTDHDSRITPVGRVIRRLRIDELPQFFNILVGDMSLVGPRAERIENVDYYCSLMPEFRYRMKVKAGLTGYAQIYGKYNTSYEDKLKMDLLYIENCSIAQDFQLLFQTVRVLFIPDSTEGFETVTISEMDRKQNEAGIGENSEAKDTEKTNGVN